MARKTWKLIGNAARIALVLVIFFAVVGGFIGNWTIARLARDADWVDHTRQVISELLLTKQRITSFVATQNQPATQEGGNAASLERIREMVVENARDVAELTVDNPAQNERAIALLEMSQSWLAKAINSSTDISIPTELIAAINKMLTEEHALLEIRSQERQFAAYAGYLSLTALSLCSLTAISISAYLLKRFVDQLIEAREHAEAANRSRGEFLANMSHEIRTPMTAILGHADILGEKCKDHEALESIDIINRNGHFLLQIINDILDLSKIDAGLLRVNRLPVRLDKLISEVQSLLSVMAAQKNLEFHIDITGRVPSQIYTDEVRFRQILINLIGNAIKFTDRGSVAVDFSYDKLVNELIVSVKDTGIGIDATNVRSVFDPFSQVDGTSTRTKEGTGLGLTICQRLAHALGGRIDVESRVGEGSVFTVRIDCGELNEVDLINAVMNVKRGDASLPQEGMSMLDCRVLVVDDRREIRFLVRRIIEKAGGNVVEASNGSEAISILKTDLESGQSIDICVLDMQMPVKDGYETASEVRALDLDLPIIALTASAMVEDRRLCLAAGCSDYIAKPIDAQHLLRTIATHCEHAAKKRVSR